MSDVNIPGVTRVDVTRNDRPWGHGIDFVLHRTESDPFRISFCCHPEFPDFDQCQAMETEEMVRVARPRLEGVVERSIEGLNHGMQILMPLNGEP